MKLFAIVALSLSMASASAQTMSDLRFSYGIIIITQDLATRIVPTVARPDRKITMSDLSQINQAPCVGSVALALDAYTPALIRALIHQIVLADDIEVWNLRVGGFQAPGLVAVNCEFAARNRQFDADSVHEGIASRTLDYAPPNWTKWESFNPPGFRYGDEAAYKAMLADPDARVVTDRLNRAGFVDRYGLAGKENDFQSYAEQVFGHGRDFAAIVGAHPAMQGKLRLLMQSYIQVAPDLAERFKASGLDQVAVLP